MAFLFVMWPKMLKISISHPILCGVWCVLCCLHAAIGWQPSVADGPPHTGRGPAARFFLATYHTKRPIKTNKPYPHHVQWLTYLQHHSASPSPSPSPHTRNTAWAKREKRNNNNTRYSHTEILHSIMCTKQADWAGALKATLAFSSSSSGPPLPVGPEYVVEIGFCLIVCGGWRMFGMEIVRRLNNQNAEPDPISTEMVSPHFFSASLSLSYFSLCPHILVMAKRRLRVMLLPMCICFVRCSSFTTDTNTPVCHSPNQHTSSSCVLCCWSSWKNKIVLEPVCLCSRCASASLSLSLLPFRPIMLCVECCVVLCSTQTFRCVIRQAYSLKMDVDDDGIRRRPASIYIILHTVVRLFCYGCRVCVRVYGCAEEKQQ